MRFLFAGFVLTASFASVAFAAENVTQPKTSAPVENTNVNLTNGSNSDIIAQVVEQTGNTTRVNLGEGLVPLSTGMTLSDGNAVFTGAESTVTLYYAANDCQFTVPSTTYFAVSSVAPCASDTSAGDTTQIIPTADAPISAAVDGEDENNNAALLVGGAVVIGGGILAVIALTGDDDDNDNPATPN